MVFCDVGNMRLHFYYKGNIWHEIPTNTPIIKPDVQIFYISVNEENERKLIKTHKNCVNLAKYLHLNSAYTGLGVDRVAACIGANDGIIIDAGSAITIDIMKNDVHLGGYILPGLTAYMKLYADISPRLVTSLNTSISLDELPQNTKNAVSYGIIKSIQLCIKDAARGNRLIFTGGDGKFFSKLFEDSIYDETLVFKGMQKVYEIYQKENSLLET